MVFKYKAAKISKPAAGITRRILAHCPEVMLTEHMLEKGAILPEHEHPHVQLVYLVSGELLVEMDGQQFTLREGDSLSIPSHISHKASALVKSVALDIFAPRRDDYL
jgi:quercetin dioxygenase-like cupin family protein